MGGCCGKAMPIEEVSVSPPPSPPKPPPISVEEPKEIVEEVPIEKEPTVERVPTTPSPTPTPPKEEVKDVKQFGKFIISEGQPDYDILPKPAHSYIGWSKDSSGNFAYIFEVPQRNGMSVIDKMVRYPKTNRLNNGCYGYIYASRRKGNPTVAFAVMSPNNEEDEIESAVKTLVMEKIALRSHLLCTDQDLFCMTRSRNEENEIYRRGRLMQFPSPAIWKKYKESFEERTFI